MNSISFLLSLVALVFQAKLDAQAYNLPTPINL